MFTLTQVKLKSQISIEFFLLLSVSFSVVVKEEQNSSSPCCQYWRGDPEPRILPSIRELGAKPEPDAPAGGENFGFPVAKTVKILEKIALRAPGRRPMTIKKEISALGC